MAYAYSKNIRGKYMTNNKEKKGENFKGRSTKTIWGKGRKKKRAKYATPQETLLLSRYGRETYTTPT